nr:polyprenyl synthetase family protein [Chloroflexota bacterium]
HDDIQDRSELRRHRSTVWRLWGEAQAINAGDALFAAAHLPLYSLNATGLAPELVLRLADEFARTTIAIVQGQVLDIGMEGQEDTGVAAYLQMIDGKTAAIVRYAAWAGALLGGADPSTAARFGEFGHSLGLGFQIRDDALGIWGSEAETGKAPSDDIRRRKRSLPLLLLRERVNGADSATITALDTKPNLDDADIDTFLHLLDHYFVRADVEARLKHFHDRARVALLASAESGPNPARDRLEAMIEHLATRSG